MSYIAKIYLKKMFKKDCWELVDGGETLKITVNNVISPIEVEKVPESPNDHFELFDDDGNVICGKSRPELYEKVRVEAHGKVYDHSNLDELVGVKVDRGEQYIVYIPNPGWKSGETHKMTVKIYQDRPIEFFIVRTVQ